MNPPEKSAINSLVSLLYFPCLSFTLEFLSCQTLFSSCSWSAEKALLKGLPSVTLYALQERKRKKQTQNQKERQTERYKIKKDTQVIIIQVHLHENSYSYNIFFELLFSVYLLPLLVMHSVFCRVKYAWTTCVTHFFVRQRICFWDPHAILMIILMIHRSQRCCQNQKPWERHSQRE